MVGEVSRQKWLFFLVFLLTIQITVYLVTSTPNDLVLFGIAIIAIIIILSIASLPLIQEWRDHLLANLFLSWILFQLSSFLMATGASMVFQEEIFPATTWFVVVATVSYLFFGIAITIRDYRRKD